MIAELDSTVSARVHQKESARPRQQSNTAIFSRSGGNQGIGFAIPANLAREVMQSLRGKGRVVRGYIGTSVQTLTPEIADAMKLKGKQTGALVGEVEPNAPAAKAGIKPAT
jgi:serine protease Do